jgi:hypothetical protein
MNKKIFIINRIIDNVDTVCDDGILCIGIYTDLEIAKKELKKIYKKETEYYFFTYRIMVYEQIENEYIFTNQIYNYSFDEFTCYHLQSDI